SLECERRERGVRAAEPGAEYQLQVSRERVVEPQPGQHAERERAGDVDDASTPRKLAACRVLDQRIEEVAGDGPERRGNQEGQPSADAHRGVGPRPTYLTT